MVPETRNIRKTYETGAKRLNLESEDCNTKFVSVIYHTCNFKYNHVPKLEVVLSSLLSFFSLLNL